MESFGFVFVLGFNVREDNVIGGFIKEVGGDGKFGVIGGVLYVDKVVRDMVSSIVVYNDFMGYFMVLVKDVVLEDGLDVCLGLGCLIGYVCVDICLVCFGLCDCYFGL